MKGGTQRIDLAHIWTPFTPQHKTARSPLQFADLVSLIRAGFISATRDWTKSTAFHLYL